jgi:hypothetical protein
MDNPSEPFHRHPFKKGTRPAEWHSFLNWYTGNNFLTLKMIDYAGKQKTTAT